MEDGYPKNINDRWGGVPDDLQAVMRWKDGKNKYFTLMHQCTPQQSLSTCLILQESHIFSKETIFGNLKTLQ